MKVKLKAVLYSILEMLIFVLCFCLVLVGVYYLVILLHSLVTWLKTFAYFSDKSDFSILFEVFLVCGLLVSIICFSIAVFMDLYDENIERLEGNPQNEEVGD